MTYEYIRAKDYCESVRDGTHDTPKPVESGYKLVTGKHIQNGRIDPTEAYYISEKDYKKINERSKVDRWDVLMSMIGNGLGRSAVVDDNPDYAIKNIALFKVGDEIKAKWLHYYLSGKEGQGRIYNSLQGSGQPFISLSYIRDFPVPNPPRDIMLKIVKVLEKYDLLIDNNQKQIKLLEEAAQRLYKEWFVDLRFPGYENTPIVYGIPEEWGFGELGDIAMDSGKKEKKDHRQQYQYYLPIDCLPKKSLAYTEKNDITLAESSLVAFMPNDILFGAMRPYFHKVVVARDKGLTRTTCFVINSKESEYWAYLLLLLFSKDTVDYATQISVGTTMPYVRWKDFIHMPILIPQKKICYTFQAIISPIIERISCLAISCEKLTQARNRLIPKLMNGEIEV